MLSSLPSCSGRGVSEGPHCPALIPPLVAQHAQQAAPVQRVGASLYKQPCTSSRRLSAAALPPSIALPAAVAEAPMPSKHHYETVGDVMTSKHIFTCRTDTSIDEALEILVENRITGLPVVDEKGEVVGVVSDYDLLSLDDISGVIQSGGIFPRLDVDWGAFNEVQKLIIKNHGKVVGDVMTEDPLVVRKDTNVEAAARILLERRIRRLPVVDDAGHLIGMFSRGDVIRAALATRRAALHSS